MNAERGNEHGTSISVVSGVDDVLQAGTGINAAPDVGSVVALENIFATVKQAAITEKESEPAVGKIVLMILGDAVRDEGEAGAQADCQVVQAPAGGGSRLVANETQPVLPGGGRPPSLATRIGATYVAPRADGTAEGGEIRLTYRELSQLIEEAIKALR